MYIVGDWLPQGLQTGPVVNQSSKLVDWLKMLGEEQKIPVIGSRLERKTLLLHRAKVQLVCCEVKREMNWSSYSKLVDWLKMLHLSRFPWQILVRKARGLCSEFRMLLHTKIHADFSYADFAICNAENSVRIQCGKK